MHLLKALCSFFDQLENIHCAAQLCAGRMARTLQTRKVASSRRLKQYDEYAVMAIGAADTRTIFGIMLASAGYACFALQDAVVKLLISAFEVPQILFVPSFVIVCITGTLARLLRHPPISKSPHRRTLVLRAGLMLVA